MAILVALERALEARDPYAGGHAARVTSIAEAIGCRLGWDSERLDTLRLGGVLHDVGKLVVSPAVLQKPGPLTAEEVEEVRRHPAAGAQLIEFVATLKPALPGVLYHHERWDGGGYPTGRAREEIPAVARILAIADSFDAMTSTRPYRAALETDAALEEVERCAGSQFDPDIARVFLEAWEAGVFAVTAALRAAAS